MSWQALPRVIPDARHAQGISMSNEWGLVTQRHGPCDRGPETDRLVRKCGRSECHVRKPAEEARIGCHTGMKVHDMVRRVLAQERTDRALATGTFVSGLYALRIPSGSGSAQARSLMMVLFTDR